MWDVTEMLSNNQRFISVFSSNYSKDELDIFIEFIRNHFSTSGGLIYLCSMDIKDRCLYFIENDLEERIKRYIDLNKLIFINRDKYLTDEGVDVDSLLKDIESAVDKIRGIENRSEKKINVYIAVDKNWSKIDEWMLSKLKEFSMKKDIRLIMKYYVEEINSSVLTYILKINDLILVDGVDVFETVKPEELVHKGLVSLCQHKVVDFKYNKVLMRNEFLENAGDIIGGVVHDINNLLVSIIGYAQFAADIDDLNEIRKCLNLVIKLAFDGRRVTEKIKKEVKGDKDNQKDVYKFDYIVKNCIDMIKHKFSFSSNLGKSSSLQLVVELNSNKYICADEYDLRHSIINIMLNGIDAMENGGVMTVRTYDEGDRIVLEISDTGEGIDEDLIDKIFKPYFTTKGYKGTGLGLSIAKRVFEEHNGVIKVESKKGEGTKFTITFPSAGPVSEYNHDEDTESNLIYEVV
jgi:signal transduction histidine kinase